MVADWRSGVQQNRPEPPRRRAIAAEELYQSMKTSVSANMPKDRPTDNNTEYTFGEYKAADYNDSKTRLVDIVNCIKANNRKKLELHAVLGVECMSVKCGYIKDKCRRHVASTDPHMFVNCIACNKSNNIKLFYDYIKDTTGYSRDYVTYFIRLAILCRNYKKVLYAVVSSDDLHRHFSYVVKKIEVDKEFWCARN